MQLHIIEPQDENQSTKHPAIMYYTPKFPV